MERKNRGRGDGNLYGERVTMMIPRMLDAVAQACRVATAYICFAGDLLSR